MFLLAHDDPLFHELSVHHQNICLCNDYHKCIKTFRRCYVFQKMFHSLKYVNRKNTISYFVQYLFASNQIEFGIIKLFFQQHEQLYALIQNYHVVNAFSDYLKDSQYYGLLKLPVDNFYFVLKKTNLSRIILVEKIPKHLIIFQDILEKTLILATPVSSMTEYD